MEWIADNWAILAPLILSIAANLTVGLQLKNAKAAAMKLIEIYADKKVTDAEKVEAFDAVEAALKDLLAFLKGITPWKSKEA